MDRKEFCEQLREISQTKLNIVKLKRAIYNAQNKKYRGSKQMKKWTIEDMQFLVDNWGKLSHKELAEKLDRSVNSIKYRASILGLKNYFLYSEEITLNRLSQIIFGRTIDSYSIGIWERYGMPFKKTIASDELEYKTIKIEDFITWFKKNKRVIDLSRTKEGCFGIKEPNWLKEKRRADKKAAAYGPHNRVWTEEEDKLLTQLVDEQILGYREISIRLKRTEGSLKRRMLDLGLTKRPVRKPPHSPWSEEQIKIVKNLWLKGYQSCIIAEYVDKSALAINGILERYKYFGDPPLKYKLEGKLNGKS